MTTTATSAPPSTNRAVLEEHLAAEKRHDAAAAAATYLEDSFYVNAALGLRFEGRDMVQFQYQSSWDFIPDMAAHYQWVEDLGDVIVQTGRITGTAGTSVLGVPATGGPVDFAFTAIISFRDGKMAGEHIWYDLDDFSRQVGVDADAVRAAAEQVMASL